MSSLRQNSPRQWDTFCLLHFLKQMTYSCTSYVVSGTHPLHHCGWYILTFEGCDVCCTWLILCTQYCKWKTWIQGLFQAKLANESGICKWCVKAVYSCLLQVYKENGYRGAFMSGWCVNMSNIILKGGSR